MPTKIYLLKIKRLFSSN